MMFDYRPGLEKIKPYSVEEKEWDSKLDANESPNNLPPLVHERVMNQIEYMAFNRYPDIGMLDLRALIAEAFATTVQNVLIGNGSSEILLALCQTFGGLGRSIVFPVPSFSMYGTYAQLTDSQAVPVTLNEDFSLSPEKVVEAAEQSKAKLIILCNPNNPTGTIIPKEDIEYIVSRVQCPVVVDEAYYEFYGQSAVNLMKKYEHLIIARTLSKAYGLAAIRVGYMLANTEIVSMVDRVMMPYHINALSLITAQVVYQMRDEFMPIIGQIIEERKRLAVSLAAIEDIIVYPSETNFILIKTKKAQQLSAYLSEKNIGIRDFSTAPLLINCIRITVGTPLENDTLCKAIKEFMTQ
ncbi:MAG: Histidinol-phosphate aminotransferase [Pelosinus sp.]|jgi:histidinol-phosphate aminotransferase|nr:Histidinol-phosphate aminotransferase [Pelosinus sp.]